MNIGILETRETGILVYFATDLLRLTASFYKMEYMVEKNYLTINTKKKIVDCRSSADFVPLVSIS